jgi:hypothetical protein
MGVVYLAHNRLMGRDEVLKVIGRHIMERPGVLDRFLREIRAVARLRHPNIVSAYHATRVGESLVFAMEYVEGLDLSKMVKAKGPLPVAHACHFAYQAALGLQHAHEEGLVHRDIKPANLMLSRKGDKPVVKVLDFGLAKVAREEKVDGGLTSEGQALGTPDYIAPEQILNAPDVDIRADIYSLGGTLYYLLTGRPPFRANSLYDVYQAHISRDADPLNLVRPEVPAELAALVAKMMAKDPARRFQTPGEVAQALTPFFKRGDAAFKRPGAEVSQAAPPVAGAVSTPTQPATDAGRHTVRAKGPAEPTVAEPRWESLIDIREPETSAEATPAVVPIRRPPWVWPSVGAGVLLLGLFVALAAGVFRVTTPDGDLVFSDLPGNGVVTVDGKLCTVQRPGGKEPARVSVAPGEHRVKVELDGVEVYGEEVQIASGEKKWVRVRYEPRVAARQGNQEAETGGVPTPGPEVVPSRSEEGREVASGFVPLFNAQNLAGWRTHPKQPGNWRVEDGILIGSGPQASHLYSERGDYKDFRLRVSARINDGGNSGVFVRSSSELARPANSPRWPDGYEAQINSTHWNQDRTGSLRAGANGTPVVVVRDSLTPPRQWFELEVVAEGNRIVVLVDGRKTAEYIDENRLYTVGHIVLQQCDPQSVAEFRRIEIKELNGSGGRRGSITSVPDGTDQERAGSPPVSATDRDGFVPLFNGKDRSGWAVDRGDPNAWRVEDGHLVAVGSGDFRRQSFLLSERTYSDFVLRFEFWLPPGSDSGVAIRAEPGEAPSPLELNLRNVPDDPRGTHAQTGAFRWSTSGRGVDYLPPIRSDLLRPSSTWNEMAIVVEGGSLHATLNGYVVQHVDLGGLSFRPNALPSLKRRAGRVGFQSHTGTVRFRSIEIKELNGPGGIPGSRAQDPSDVFPLMPGYVVRSLVLNERIRSLRAAPEEFFPGTAWVMMRNINGVRTPIFERIILARDGSIRGSDHPNETYWKVAGGKLLFMNHERIVTTVFDKIFYDGGRLGIWGKHQHSPTVHELVALP